MRYKPPGLYTGAPHSRAAQFEIVEDNEHRLVLRDLGPWHVHLTITNDAERVFHQLEEQLGDRKLLYYDSEGELTEIIREDDGTIRFLDVS